jgi:hypothetical protein
MNILSNFNSQTRSKKRAGRISVTSATNLTYTTSGDYLYITSHTNTVNNITLNIGNDTSFNVLIVGGGGGGGAGCVSGTTWVSKGGNGGNGGHYFTTKETGVSDGSLTLSNITIGAGGVGGTFANSKVNGQNGIDGEPTQYTYLGNTRKVNGGAGGKGGVSNSNMLNDANSTIAPALIAGTTRGQVGGRGARGDADSSDNTDSSGPMFNLNGVNYGGGGGGALKFTAPVIRKGLGGNGGNSAFYSGSSSPYVFTLALDGNTNTGCGGGGGLGALAFDTDSTVIYNSGAGDGGNGASGVLILYLT